MPSILTFLLAVLLGLPFLAAHEIERLPALPDGVGVAGAYVGEINGELIVAGGANFPVPLWEGGEKRWHDTIYALNQPDGEWRVLGRLKRPTAYGGAVSLGDGMLCFGGGDADRYFDHVTWLSLREGELISKSYPPLPHALANFAWVKCGSYLHVLGGTRDPQAKEALNTHWVKNLDDPTSGWMQAASIPGPGRLLPIAGASGDAIFVFSGASLNPDGSRTYLKTGYRYDPGKGWSELPEMPRAALGAPTPLVTLGGGQLLIVGGDDGSQVGTKPTPDHPGFARDFLLFDPKTGEWQVDGEMPAEFEAPVTTSTSSWRGAWVLASGEASPGRRTPQMILLTPTDQATIKGESKLGWLNWTVLATYLLMMVAVGWWFMKRNAAASTDAYFRGGQKIPSWVVGMSIFATSLSSLTFMGIPARSFQTDCSWYLGQLTILLVVPVVAAMYLPFFRKLNVTTAYEFLEHRFNLACRLFGCFAFILFHLGRIGIVLYLPAIALASVSDIAVDQAILWIGVLCIIYTVMGGITAVVWTDAIQALVLMGGALLCLGIAVFQAEGGISQVWEVATTQNKLFQSVEWGGFSIAEGTGSAAVLLIAFFFNSLVPYTSGQDLVQRYVTTPNIAEAKKSLKITMWMSVFGSAVFFALGVAVFAFYQTQPEALDPRFAKNDSILPFFILQQLPTGISGLVIAAIFAASQSTISSSLNSISSTWITDIDARLLRPDQTDKVYLKGAQIVVLVAGILGVGAALWMANSNVDSAFKVFNTFVGLAAGSLGGVFALGVFTKKVSGQAAFVGALIGFVSVLLIHFSELPVTGLLYAAIGFGICFISGLILAPVFPTPTNKNS